MLFDMKRSAGEDSKQDQKPQTQNAGRAEIKTASYSVIGDRPHQEDAVYISSEEESESSGESANRVLAVVCDGMGGMTNGGLASATAIQMIKDAFEQVKQEETVNIPNFLISGIKSIDKTVYEIPKENARGSGTTMVAVIIEDNQLYWASVGDSRIYLWHDGVLRQVSRDHNYMMRLQEMVDQGLLTQEDADFNRQREALISFLGIGDISLMDVNMEPFEMQDGDIVLLSSDGMTKVLSEEQIADILKEDTSVQEKAEKLVETSVNINVRLQDNTTVAVLQYQETK